MAEGLELVSEALWAYWTAPIPLAILAACWAAMGTLLYVFIANGRNPKLRVSLLTGLYALVIFFWSFVAVSLLLCVWQASTVAYRSWGVQIAAAGAVTVALSASVVISAVVWRFGSRSIIRRLQPVPLPQESRWVQEYANLLADFEGIKSPTVLLTEQEGPFAMTVGGKVPRILISRGLLTVLNPREVETVIAHEVMHLKHHDAEFKVFSRVLSRLLFFDPFSKFFDPAVHREREYLADETSGRVTGRPTDLASALIKLSESKAPVRATLGLSILGPGGGIFSPYPPLGERIQRLLALSHLLADRRQSG